MLRNIVESQLENKYNEENLLEMIDTITPYNLQAEIGMDSNRKRIQSKVTQEKINNNSIKSSTQMVLNFPSEKSKKLFLESVQNHTKMRNKKEVNGKEVDGKEVEETNKEKLEGALYQYRELSGNRIHISQRDDLVLNIKNADSKSLLENSKKHEKRVMASLVFEKVVAGVLQSGLYQTATNKTNRLLEKQISNKEELDERSDKLRELYSGVKSRIAVDSLYKKTLFAHAIKNNPALDKKILDRLEKANNQMPIRNGQEPGLNIIEKVFKGYNVNSPDTLLDSKNSFVRKALYGLPMITRKEVNDRKPESVFDKMKNYINKELEGLKNVVNIGTSKKIEEPNKQKENENEIKIDVGRKNRSRNTYGLKSRPS